MAVRLTKNETINGKTIEQINTEIQKRLQELDALPKKESVAKNSDTDAKTLPDTPAPSPQKTPSTLIQLLKLEPVRPNPRSNHPILHGGDIYAMIFQELFSTYGSKPAVIQYNALTPNDHALMGKPYNNELKIQLDTGKLKGLITYKSVDDLLPKQSSPNGDKMIFHQNPSDSTKTTSSHLAQIISTWENQTLNINISKRHTGAQYFLQFDNSMGLSMKVQFPTSKVLYENITYQFEYNNQLLCAADAIHCGPSRLAMMHQMIGDFLHVTTPLNTHIYTLMNIYNKRPA